VRYQVQAARVGLDIRGSGEELAIKTKMTSTCSHDHNRTAVFGTDEGTSGGGGNAIVNEALFLSEKRYFPCTEEIKIPQIIK
jgi:thioredoxin reductase